MNTYHKYNILENKIKKLLRENFPKNTEKDKYDDIKKVFLNDKEFLHEISTAIEEDFNITDMNMIFTADEICSIIDADDAVNYIGDTELLDEIDNDTIIRYLEEQDCDPIYIKIDKWSPCAHIQEACCKLSPKTAKTAEDMKRLVCDEIDFQNTGNVLI